MTKLLILLLIILIAFWLGKMSVSKKRGGIESGKKKLRDSVIDVKVNDE